MMRTGLTKQEVVDFIDESKLPLRMYACMIDDNILILQRVSPKKVRKVTKEGKQNGIKSN